MTIALWIVNILLAAAFLAAGSMKATRSKEQLAAAGMAWTEDYSAAAVRLIGVAEVLGAVGLVLPLALSIAPILTPVAAVALAATMVGAVLTHVRRRESFTPSLVLGVVSVVSAVLGFLVILG